MELVVLSGKGGAGKTTVAVSLSFLANNSTKIDCDVDAPNMYLYYDMEDIKRDNFYGGKTVVRDNILCKECGLCKTVCNFKVISNDKINNYICEGCGACVITCPNQALKLVDEKTADIFISKTSNGIISRAKMKTGSEGSGKLIYDLRKNAKEYTVETNLTIIDSSPGIGCPVMSSLTGADIALLVTEPTKAGVNDLLRVMELCKHFNLKIYVCINKFDLNDDISKEIQEICLKENIEVIGKIPYDDTVMKSINDLRPIITYENSRAGEAINRMWCKIKKYLKEIKYEYNSSSNK